MDAEKKLRAITEDGPPDLDVRLAGRDPETGEQFAYRLTGEDLVELASRLEDRHQTARGDTQRWRGRVKDELPTSVVVHMFDRHPFRKGDVLRLVRESKSVLHAESRRDR